MATIEEVLCECLSDITGLDVHNVTHYETFEELGLTQDDYVELNESVKDYIGFDLQGRTFTSPMQLVDFLSNTTESSA